MDYMIIIDFMYAGIMTFCQIEQPFKFHITLVHHILFLMSAQLADTSASYIN
jgi:hypothetical protein